jgi:cysteine desulfurase
MIQRRLYLDWNATAPAMPQVRQAVVRAFEDAPGNASSIHREGQAARAIIERARRSVAKAVGAPAQAVVFSGGATESNNQVLHHHVATTDEPYLVCTAVEHPSVIEVVDKLSEQGVRTARWPVDSQGRLDLNWLDEQLAAGATMVSVMWANNEMGNIYDVAAIAEKVHEAGALLHVDGTQALGRIDVDFQQAGVDYLTLSFHKMGGPKGVGATIVREGLKVGALMAGGHQERGRRPGTENVPMIAGVDAAARELVNNLSSWKTALGERKNLFVDTLRGAVPDLELRGNGERQLANTVNVAFPGVDGEDLLLALDLEGISASSGSACTAGSLEPSHVILAMGFEDKQARESLRFSFGPTTSIDELEQGARRIAEIVGRLRRLEAEI